MRLCWILLEDMIVEAFGDILPLNTFVHFCQTFLEGILVRHSFERVVFGRHSFETHTGRYILRRHSQTLVDLLLLAATCYYKVSWKTRRPLFRAPSKVPSARNFGLWKSYHFRSRIPTGIHGSLRVFYGYLLHFCQICCTKRWSAFFVCKSCKMTQDWATRWK